MQASAHPGFKQHLLTTTGRYEGQEVRQDGREVGFHHTIFDAPFQHALDVVIVDDLHGTRQTVYDLLSNTPGVVFLLYPGCSPL